LYLRQVASSKFHYGLKVPGNDSENCGAKEGGALEITVLIRQKNGLRDQSGEPTYL